GAGKTTTINLFLGFVPPTSGHLSVDGIDVLREPARARTRVAYVPENVMLYSHLSGLENLEFFARLSLRAKTSRDELLVLLESVGMSRDAAFHRSGTYSKGMRQKVGMAVALARNVPVMLLDEPLSGLDPLAANEVSHAIRGLSARGIAVLMATHDIFRAKDTGHRIGIMRGGRLVRELETRSIEHLALEKLYLEIMVDAA
ncbi:MAG: ABC transporter ATP-binding protein, partial [Clostridia bacterium]|nr:ABC transporter ATP-binding protein [Deltaproteobacteria bacterium]